MMKTPSVILDLGLAQFGSLLIRVRTDIKSHTGPAKRREAGFCMDSPSLSEDGRSTGYSLVVGSGVAGSLQSSTRHPRKTAA